MILRCPTCRSTTPSPVMGPRTQMSGDTGVVMVMARSRPTPMETSQSQGTIAPTAMTNMQRLLCDAISENGRAEQRWRDLTVESQGRLLTIEGLRKTLKDQEEVLWIDRETMRQALNEERTRRHKAEELFAETP